MLPVALHMRKSQIHFLGIKIFWCRLNSPVYSYLSVFIYILCSVYTHLLSNTLRPLTQFHLCTLVTLFHPSGPSSFPAHVHSMHPSSSTTLLCRLNQMLQSEDTSSLNLNRDLYCPQFFLFILV